MLYFICKCRAPSFKTIYQKGMVTGMITLKPITSEQMDIFDGCSFAAMSDDEKIQMIAESNNLLHDGKYFELLVVYSDNEIIGFMSLYAHSAHIISCGPEIKLEFQRRGYAFEAEKAALDYAKEKGFRVAVGYVDENNIASVGLHEKLGFELDMTYVNEKNRAVKVYIKAL